MIMTTMLKRYGFFSHRNLYLLTHFYVTRDDVCTSQSWVAVLESTDYDLDILQYWKVKHEKNLYRPIQWSNIREYVW